MMGKRNGVAVILTRTCPKLISINHRLALAAADHISYLQKFKDHLFYQHSAVRMANLHAIQEVLYNRIKNCEGCLMAVTKASNLSNCAYLAITNYKCRDGMLRKK